MKYKICRFSLFMCHLHQQFIYLQALHPGWALFLLYGLKDFPRTMFLYLYLFEYETMFVPFIHVVCPLSEAAPKYDFTSPVSVPY